MIKADFHTHTQFSADSNEPIKNMIEKSIELGLEYLCITDHMDYDYTPEPNGDIFEFDINKRFKEIERYRAEYGDKIKILDGIELGLQPYLSEKLRKLLDSHNFDFVIASSHVVDGIDPYYKKYWEGISVTEGIEKYFDSIILNLNEFSDFDAYGHIDYIIRYIPSDRARAEHFAYKTFGDIIDKVLLSIIKMDRAIEVNTGGYKYGLENPNPSLEIIKRYFELGGKFVTIGSDAHDKKSLAYEFKRVQNDLLLIGVKEYAVFEKRKPTIIRF